MLGRQAGTPTLISLSQDMPTPLPPFRPAAMSIILQVVCDLQTEEEVVLPRKETDLTSPGLRPEKKAVLVTVLLTIHKGLEAFRPLCLWKPTSGAEFGWETIAMLGMAFRMVESMPSRMWLPTLLASIEVIELARPIPPRALQFIIIILLSNLALLPTAIARVRFLYPMRRALHLTQETVTAVFPRMPGREKPLLKLATILPAAFLITIDVLTMGLFAVLPIAFP